MAWTAGSPRGAFPRRRVRARSVVRPVRDAEDSRHRSSAALPRSWGNEGRGIRSRPARRTAGRGTGCPARRSSRTGIGKRGTPRHAARHRPAVAPCTADRTSSAADAGGRLDVLGGVLRLAGDDYQPEPRHIHPDLQHGGGQHHVNRGVLTAERLGDERMRLSLFPPGLTELGRESFPAGQGVHHRIEPVLQPPRDRRDVSRRDPGCQLLDGEHPRSGGDLVRDPRARPLRRTLVVTSSSR
jgi:hypothetical protein